MARAAILIGVQKAPALAELHAVWEGVDAMQAWAEQQQIDFVKIITDRTEKVRGYQISDAVAELIKPENRIEQLLIYFAGHGINRNYSEFWLLSDAPSDPNAAVNVAASIQRARYSGVRHVVFISDACRTAPSSIQASGMMGSVIFHNPPGGDSGDVDVFYATWLGEPALEISDPQVAAREFLAVYTDVLVGALGGEQDDLVEHDDSGKRLIRPRPLSDFLKHELPIRVYNMTTRNPRSQKPEAVICSDNQAWLSAIADDVAPVAVRRAAPTPESVAHADFINQGMENITVTTREVLENPDVNVETLFTKGPPGVARPRSDATAPPELDVVTNLRERYANQVLATTSPFGKRAFETECGFNVRGAKFVSCIGHNANYDIIDDGNTIRAYVEPGRVVSTLIRFESGDGVLLPAIGQFVANLTIDGTNLIDVTYEPAENSPRWPGFAAHEKQIRRLRAVVASSTRMGTFRLEGDGAEKIARQMQIEKGLDPTLALYAAHAYRSQGQQQRLGDMADFMQSDLGMCLFDIALMAGRFNGQQIGSVDDVRPTLPMLAQTWPLLPAYDATLPAPLADLPRHVMSDSLWTVYDDEGTELISPFIESGDIR
jgi:hypothetical protein